MERKLDRSPDVERAATRLARPRARASLALKRLLDIVLSAAMLVAVTPVFIVVGLLLLFDGERFIEQRTRLGRHGEPVVLSRFPELPGGAFGRLLERAGVRELPLLFAVLRGRISFVGPRVLPPGTTNGHTGPRRLMAPGLTGPAQLGCPREGADLDDTYVESWTLWNDAVMLAGRCPKGYQSVSKSTS
jgi:lipopolysaccharide/colanic/teichoic acid biosynthesis glycosyltransferase